MTRRPYADAADLYWSAGWPNPIPVKGKWPPPTGYTGYDGANVSYPDLQAWKDGAEGEHNIALRLPADVVGIDVDAHDGRTGETTLIRAEERLGSLPPAPRSTAREPFGPSGIRLYRVPADANLRGAEKRFRAAFGEGVDIIRRDHRYAVVWPSVHPGTGTTYRWYDDTADTSMGRDRPPTPAELPDLPESWLSFLTAPVPTEVPAPSPTPGALNTWDLLERTGRCFTHDQAVDFVRPFLVALQSAPVGAINNRLNDAAYVLGRFTPTVFTRQQAEAWLHQALSATEYDGRTWRAETTITSGLDAPGWTATLVQERDPAWVTPDGRPAEPEGDREAWILREVARLHLRAEATDRFSAERHAASWTAPADYGTLAAELALPDRPVAWRVKGLLGIGHNAVLVAGRKVGKTTMVNELVRAYVDGGPFLGRFDVTETDQAVAVWNYEVDTAQYRRWLRELEIINAERVYVLSLRGSALPLRHPRVRAWVVAWLAARRIGLWLVDPYSRAYVGSLDNGNDEAQVGAFLDTLDVIKHEAGVGELVMPVHTPKARVEAGEETAIGSQRLEAWPDALWYLTRDQDTGLRFLRAEGRDVDVPEEQLTYDSASRRLSFGGWDRMGVRSKAAIDAVTAFVADNPGCTQNTIQHGLQWGVGRTQQGVRAAIHTGRVRVTDLPKSNGGRQHWPA